MADVFISYKSERVGAVAHLAAIIEAHGFSVWFDVRGLSPGPSFGPQIEAALRKAKVALVLWCGKSKASDWVIEEADLAKELGTYLPAHMETGETPPLGYRTGQALQLQDWTGDPYDHVLDRLFEALEARLGREAVNARRMISEIRRDWQLRGSPNFVGEKLQAAPDETTINRVWSAPTAPRVLSPPPPPQSPPPPAIETPSSRAWAKVKSSENLHDYDDFLLAFPNVPEAEACRKARAQLAKRKEAEALVAARRAAFENLPTDGYDLRPFDAFIETHRGTDEAFQAARLRRECEARIAASSPPDDATRGQWELEAAVALLTGQPIPPARQPHLRALPLSGFSDELFEALKRRGAPLADIYVDPEADFLSRRLKLADIRALSALTGLQTLNLMSTQVSDISALSALTGLQTLDLMSTQVSDISALSALTGLQTLDLWGTQVSDWSPVDHVDDVDGRPEDWPRKARG